MKINSLLSEKGRFVEVALRLRNPHSVLAAIEKRPRSVIEVRLTARNPDGAWREVADRAAAEGIPVIRGARNERNEKRGRRDSGGKQPQPQEAGGRAGAGEAMLHEHEERSLEELFGDVDPAARSGLWLAFDHIQDPHNVGAVFRSAAFFGVRGVVATRDRSAPLNATVYDVASGGMEHVPFAVQANLARALDVAKERGLWILGAAEESSTDIADIPRDRPWLLVLGNEEDGLRRLTRDKCDMICRISSRGRVGSLNVSVAAGVLTAALTSPVR